MKDVREWLKEADPVATEPGLSDADIGRIRYAMQAAIAHRRPAVPWQPFAVATAVALVLVAPLVINSLARPGGDAVSVSGDATPSSAPRQLQFATPGGTRVIWVFNPDFKQ